MKIKDIAAVIESYAPRESAEEWDNVGLMLGDAERECTGVLTCLDCTLDVAKQAKAAGCNLVVTHHPFIFRPVGRLTADTTKGKTAEFLFSNEGETRPTSGAAALRTLTAQRLRRLRKRCLRHSATRP